MQHLDLKVVVHFSVILTGELRDVLCFAYGHASRSGDITARLLPFLGPLL